MEKIQLLPDNDTFLYTIDLLLSNKNIDRSSG